jgi:Ca2+-binding EF-hand superfamily protein
MDQFEVFDLDKNDAITQAEVDQFRQSQITEFDANKDGTLSIDEYQALWLSVMREQMVDAFQEHDDDGDGQVTTEEFNERFTGMIDRLDRNGDGKLDAGDYERRRRQASPEEPEDDEMPEAESAPGPAPEPTPQP